MKIIHLFCIKVLFGMQGVQSLLGMCPQHIMALLPTILYDGTVQSLLVMYPQHIMALLPTILYDGTRSIITISHVSSTHNGSTPHNFVLRNKEYNHY
jgi:hypothetical protein